KTFHHEADFFNFLQLLESHQIPYQTETFNFTIDPATLRSLEKEFHIKVRQMDFAQVIHLLDDMEAEAIKNTDRDHYLFSFSDIELYEIIARPDEWSALDYHLAKKILKERGQTIDDDFLKALKEVRLEDLSKQEKAQPMWIISGYVFAMLGGIVGVIIGWHMKTRQKTLPSGQRAFVFREKDRKHGSYIFFVGMVVFVLLILMYLITNPRL
ncbi:MAG TPA: hypothetical protein VGE24_15455, partial [Emticicia sp.]